MGPWLSEENAKRVLPVSCGIVKRNQSDSNEKLSLFVSRLVYSFYTRISGENVINLLRIFLFLKHWKDKGWRGQVAYMYAPYGGHLANM